jgi:hypothetical protein
MTLHDVKGRRFPLVIVLLLVVEISRSEDDGEENENGRNGT